MTEELFLYCISYILNCWKFQAQEIHESFCFLSLHRFPRHQALLFFPKVYLQSLPMHSYSFFLGAKDPRFLRSTYKLMLYCAVSS